MGNIVGQCALGVRDSNVSFASGDKHVCQQATPSLLSRLMCRSVKHTTQYLPLLVFALLREALCQIMERLFSTAHSGIKVSTYTSSCANLSTGCTRFTGLCDQAGCLERPDGGQAPRLVRN